MTYRDIAILHEDNHILVVVKPRGIPVAADETGDENLLDMLKQYLVDSKNKPGKAYLGLVHRLDRPAGGVMVFAKTTKAAERLSEAIRNHTIEKRYLAIISGVPREKRATLTNYLLKDAEKNKVRVVPMATEGAKKAVLSYKILDWTTDGKYSLADVDLETGRAHQIRIQMATAGHPLYGDHKYGDARGRSELALWSYRLRFTHPTTKETMSFIAYPPADEEPYSFFDINRFLTVKVNDD